MNRNVWLVSLCLWGLYSGLVSAETTTPKRVTAKKQGDDVLLSMDVTRVELRGLMEEIAAVLELNVVFHHLAKGTVTAKFVDVPWKQAVELILKSNLLVMDREDKVLLILPLTSTPQ